MEKLIVIDRVHTGLALYLDVKSAVIISLVNADWVSIVVNGD